MGPFSGPFLSAIYFFLNNFHGGRGQEFGATAETRVVFLNTMSIREKEREREGMGGRSDRDAEIERRKESEMNQGTEESAVLLTFMSWHCTCFFGCTTLSMGLTV